LEKREFIEIRIKKYEIEMMYGVEINKKEEEEAGNIQKSKIFSFAQNLLLI